MTQLRDFNWWPSTWINETERLSAPNEISKDGVLKNVRRMYGSLTLVADHNGVIYTAKITPHLSEDYLIFLRHILLQHWGEPLSAVEQLDVSFDDWK